MTGTRKRYPASFRARVALEAAKQTRTLAELSGRYQVHSVQISQWKKQLLDGIESLFRDGRRRDHDESQAIQAELYEQIGRLKMELEWLKKKLPASIELKRLLIEQSGSTLTTPNCIFRKAVLHRKAGQPAEAGACWRRILTRKCPD